MGLLGTYFNEDDLTNIALIRVDPELDFYWGSGSPDPSMQYSSYSVVWEGEIESPVSETITFTATTDDGVRLYVNNQIVIDRWQDQEATGWTGSIAMTAWTRVPIRVEYYEKGAYASARLEWASSSMGKEVVPSHFLYPASVSSFPVELLEFEAMPGDEVVDLMWTTASELNSDYFQVERSLDGEVFEGIQRVNAAGESQELLSYEAVDRAPYRGTSYYRLQAVDLDGSYTYSEVKEVYLDWQEVVIYPNPLGLSRQLFVEINSVEDQEWELVLTDVTGKLVRQQLISPQQANQRIPVNMESLPKGLYLIQLSGETSTHIEKILLK